MPAFYLSQAQPLSQEILFGVYNDTLIFPNLPAHLLSLHFRISIKLDRSDFNVMNFSVRGPDDSELMSTSGALPAQKTTESTVIDIGVQGVVFPRAGTYLVCLRLDQKPEKIWSFELRLPVSDDERLPIGLVQRRV
jgi:hypothetical protein